MQLEIGGAGCKLRLSDASHAFTIPSPNCSASVNELQNTEHTSPLTSNSTSRTLPMEIPRKQHQDLHFMGMKGGRERGRVWRREGRRKRGRNGGKEVEGGRVKTQISTIMTGLNKLWYCPILHSFERQWGLFECVDCGKSSKMRYWMNDTKCRRLCTIWFHLC